LLGGGEHSLPRTGLGESQFRRGAYTVVLFICTYFVVDTESRQLPASLVWRESLTPCIVDTESRLLNASTMRGVKVRDLDSIY
jgi:hypothetical protein